MIGFEKGDPSRPYVMGSLFHRDTTHGIAKDNTIRSIKTKSGHTIEFNDDAKGAWGITIKDREGNVLRMDTKNKNIEISAPETMSLNARNINIFAKDNMNLTSGKDMSQNVAGNFAHFVEGNSTHSVGKNLSSSIDGNHTVIIGKSFTNNIKEKMEQTAKKIEITADKGTAKILAKDKLTLKSSTEVIISQ